jgi:OOP family OmpA-OmpF porin
MPGDPKGKVVAAAGPGSQAPAGRGSTSRSDATPGADGSGGTGAQTARPEAAGPARQSPDLETPARPEQTLAAAHADPTREPAAPDLGAVDAGQHGASGADAARSAGASTSSADAARSAGAGTSSGDDAGHAASGRGSGADAGSATGGAGAAAAGRAGSVQGDSNPSTAQSNARSGATRAGTEADPTGAGGAAQAGTGGLSEGRGSAADAGPHSGAAGASSAGAGGASTAAESSAGLDRAGSTAAGAAGQTGSGASDGGNSLSREGSGQLGQAGKQEEVVIGLVETPGKKATPTETVIPQTLGGMLPMTLGVEGEGEFDFDKAVLRDQVRIVLDQLAGKLKTAEYDRLEIIGHTDRIGTEVYNQYLSERRAWAVARYLIQQGVPANKVRVEGRGMHEPVTAANACSGLTREATITCLQDDRRVVISASIRRVDVNVH